MKILSINDFYNELSHFFSTPEGHNELANHKISIIDVRTPQEYKRVHIKGSINFPVDEIENNLEAISQFTKIYIICMSGGRATYACNILARQCDCEVVLIKGGVPDWHHLGYPVNIG